MKYSLLFSLEIPGNSRKRYKEARLGFNWPVVFFHVLVPFIKDDAMRLGWYMLLSMMATFFITVILFAFYIFSFNAEIIILSFLYSVLLLWGFYYNKLYIQHLLKNGYVPEDEYTQEILKKEGLWQE